jgi:hypothetical protein
VDEEKYIVLYMWYAIVRHRHAKDTETLGSRFLKTKDLENMKVNGKISLAANTRLEVIP